MSNTIPNEDTIHLLKECDAGTKMAVASIDEVLEDTQSPNLKLLLSKSKEHHERLGNELHGLLLSAGSQDKEPAPVAKGMSWMKTNVKLTMDHSDATIADLITDGCNMGIKSLYRYKNQYPAADKKARDICTEIASIEEDLAIKLREYL